MKYINYSEKKVFVRESSTVVEDYSDGDGRRRDYYSSSTIVKEIEVEPSNDEKDLFSKLEKFSKDSWFGEREVVRYLETKEFPKRTDALEFLVELGYTELEEALKEAKSNDELSRVKALEKRIKEIEEKTNSWLEKASLTETYRGKSFYRSLAEINSERISVGLEEIKEPKLEFVDFFETNIKNLDRLISIIEEEKKYDRYEIVDNGINCYSTSKMGSFAYGRTQRKIEDALYMR